MRVALLALAVSGVLGCRAYDRALYESFLDVTDARGAEVAVGSDTPIEATRPDAVDDAMDAQPPGDVPAEDVFDGGGADAMDAGMDAGMDARTDAGSDAMDARTDAMDAGMDVRADVRTDAGSDAMDARPDVRPDVATDSMPDVLVSIDVPVVDVLLPDIVFDAVTRDTADSGCLARLVINEVSTRGVSSGADEFLEILNTGDCAVSLEGFTIRLHTEGAESTVVWTGSASHTIAPGAYFVVGGTTFTGPAASRFTAFYLGGTSALPSGDTGVGLFDPSGVRVDSVGYGGIMGSPYTEGTPYSGVPGATESVARFPNGADTNNNSADFRLSAPPTPNRAN